MTEQFYTILTQIGKASIANATSLGTKVEFKYFALGDGNGSYYNPTETQTSLKNEIWRGQIAQITVDEKNPNWIVLETVIPSNVGGFTIREAGVFDTEGNLLAVGKYPETYKPVVADGSVKDLYIRMILEVSNTSAVTLKIDPTVILATKKDIDILDNKIAEMGTDVDGRIEVLDNKITKVDTDTNSRIDQLFQYGLDGKTLLETTIESKGVEVSKEGDIATFKEISDAIEKIKTSGIAEHEIVRKSHDGTESPIYSPIELEYYYRIFENTNINDITIENVNNSSIIDMDKIEINGEVLLLHCKPLDSNTTYKITIPLNALKDKLGNTLNGIYKYSFTTKEFSISDMYLITPSATIQDINEAIKMVGMDGGGEFYFAEGEYLLDEPIIIRHSNIILHGTPLSILKRNGNFSYIIDKITLDILPEENRNSDNGVRSGVIDIRGIENSKLSNIRINNFTIDGNYSETELSYGIYCKYIGKDNIGISIDGCIIRNSRTAGIILEYCNDCNIRDNNIHNNGTQGIDIRTSNDNRIVENITQNNAYGIYSISSSNNIISRNMVQNNKYNGISLYTPSDGDDIINDNNTITKNIVKDNGLAGIGIDPSYRNTITGNVVQSNQYGISLEKCSNNIVSGNIACYNKHTGILIRDTSYTTVMGNICELNTSYGIMISGTGTCTRINIISNIMHNNKHGNYSADSSVTRINKQSNQETV